MITDEEVEKLGKALVDIHRQYDAEDVAKILNYSFERRVLDGYPHDLARVLELIAARLRTLPRNGFVAAFEKMEAEGRTDFIRDKQ